MTLVPAKLLSCLVFFLTSFARSKWLVGKANRLLCAFLWKGLDECNGGHCFVSLEKVCRPKHLGRLGIKNIEAYSSSLRLR